MRGAGAQRATETFDRKVDAVQAGRDLARRQGTELVIHGINGQIQSKDSYGNDPFPPKG